MEISYLSQVKLQANRKAKTRIYAPDLESGSVLFPRHQVYQLSFFNLQTNENSTEIGLTIKRSIGVWDRGVQI